ncbi:MAG: RsbRD N-terminal domain-containing protein [Acidobacteriota bacterium]|jgi:hypothetical protein
MSVEAVIVERWVDRALKSYPSEMHSFLGGEKDPFRNPVGNTFRENLAALVHELLGTMDKEKIAGALDGLVRLRAVQNFTPGEALHFVFDLRPVIGEVSGAISDPLQSRIDELALMAFDQYMSCRERIFELRINELRMWARSAAAGEGGTP